MLLLRQELQSSAQRCMSKGGTSSLQTLAIESELREVQQRASELQKKGNSLINQVEKLLQKENWIFRESSDKILISEDKTKCKVNFLKIESSPSTHLPQNYYDELKKKSIERKCQEDKRRLKCFTDLAAIERESIK